MNVVVGVIVDIKDEHGEVIAEQNVEDDGEGENTTVETEDDHDKVLEVELHIEGEDGNRDMNHVRRTNLVNNFLNMIMYCQLVNLKY